MSRVSTYTVADAARDARMIGLAALRAAAAAALATAAFVALGRALRPDLDADTWGRWS